MTLSTSKHPHRLYMGHMGGPMVVSMLSHVLCNDLDDSGYPMS